MNIYTWKSDYLRDYYPGTIITAAPNLELARVQARTKLLGRLSSDAAENESAFRELEKDLMTDPEILPIEEAVFIIGGS